MRGKYISLQTLLCTLKQSNYLLLVTISVSLKSFSIHKVCFLISDIIFYSFFLIDLFHIVLLYIYLSINLDC